MMWYVLDAKKDTTLIYGLNRDSSKNELKDALSNGTIDKYLRYVPIKKNDVFFIEAGTIHAINEGALVAEIQESSNLTYRLYDYDRIDKNGNKRKLHIDKALDVANLSSSIEPKQPIRVLRYSPGCAYEKLCSCKYFEVYRMLLNTDRKQVVKYHAGNISYKVLLCTNGCGTIIFNSETIAFYKGDCIFIPANSIDMILHGQAQFLDVRG